MKNEDGNLLNSFSSSGSEHMQTPNGVNAFEAVFCLNEGELFIEKERVIQVIKGEQDESLEKITAVTGPILITGNAEGETTANGIHMKEGYREIIIQDIVYSGNQCVNLLEGVEAVLVLTGTSQITIPTGSQAAVHVGPESGLTVRGDGRMEITVNGGGAGIGGNGGESNGNVVVESGDLKIIASGRFGGAGIGAGGGSPYGDITILGGTIETVSNGLLTAPGIGSQTGRGGGIIEIAGGVINASGGWGSTLIGNGGYSSGTVRITGGKVVTKAHYQTPGIRADRLYIEGGEVDFTSTTYIGDPGAEVNYLIMTDGKLTSYCRNESITAGEQIWIKNGEINCQGVAMSSGQAVLSSKEVLIEDGNISLKASGGNNAAIKGQNIQISGGALSAVGDGSAAAIGYWEKNLPTGKITITGGNIRATGGPVSESAVGGTDYEGNSIYPTNGEERVYETEIPVDWMAGKKTITIGDSDYPFETVEGDSSIFVYLPEGMYVVGTETDNHTVYAGPDSSRAKVIPLSVMDKSSGNLLPEAMVRITDSLNQQVYRGRVPKYLNVLPGDYQMEASCEGFYPKRVSITIKEEDNEEIRILLNSVESAGNWNDILGAYVTSKQMSRDEILAAGIDPDAEGNQHLFQFKVVLEFEVREIKLEREFVYIGNDEGEPVGDKMIVVKGDGDGEYEQEEIYVYPKSSKYYLVIYGKTRWLKEMFDVELLVVNHSSEETLEDCEAELADLPAGISLADMSGEEQSLKVNLGSIAKNMFKSHHWYLRGDEEGSYTVSGRVTAKASGNGRAQTADFITEEPLEVKAGSAMHLYITVGDSTRGGEEPYEVLFELVNVSNHAVNNLSFSLDHEKQYSVTKYRDKESIRVYEDKDLEGNTLKIDRLVPGEVLVFQYMTQIRFPILLGALYYELVNEWLEVMEGSTTIIPHTFIVTINWLLKELIRQELEYNSLEGCISRDPVDVLSGDFTWSYSDLTLQGKHNLSYTRSYRSGQKVFGRLGAGWSDNFDYHLYQKKDQIQIQLPYGGLSYFTKHGDGWRAGEGSPWKLRKSENNYILTTQDQNQYLFDRNGFLREIAAWGGNTIECSYNSQRQLKEVKNNSGSLRFSYREDGRLSGLEDSAGRTLQYVYDEKGYLCQAENPDGDSFRYGYDENGYLTTVENLNGEIIVENKYDEKGRTIYQYAEGLGAFDYQYDDEKRTHSYARSDGSRVTIVYDEQKRIVEKTDEDGKERYTYNSANQKTEKVDRRGNRTTYQYDQNSNLARIIYADGSSESFVYNENNLPVKAIDPEGFVTLYEYNEAGKMTKNTDGRGNETTYCYDNRQNLIEVCFPDGSKQTSTYDKAGNCLTVTDVMGNVTSYTYDKAGRVLTQTDPEGNTVSFAYTSAGKLESETDACGHITRYQYNGNGYCTGKTNAKGDETQYTYNKQNVVSSMVDPEGFVTQYEYDELGNRSAVTDGNGNTISYVCDGEGRVTSMTDANGNTTGYQYDENGNRTRVIDALGGVATAEYDVRNRRIGQTDVLGNTVKYKYNKNGKIAKITDAMGMETSFRYDGNGNLSTVIDGKGNRTSYQYDRLNRVVETIDNCGNRTEYTYDAAGNLSSMTDGAGRRTGYGYDRLHRPISRTDGNGNIRQTEYNALGQVICTINERGARTHYQYDEVGNIKSVTDALGACTEYEYDRAGRLISEQKPNGAVTGYHYDGVGNLTEIWYPDGNMESYQYDGNGNMIVHQDGNGNVTFHNYDALDRMIQTTYGDGSSKRYSYDAMGNLLSQTDENGHTTKYTYDGCRRLIKTLDPIGHETRREYDVLGNLMRVIAEGGNSGEQITAYNYDENNRLIEEIDALGQVIGYQYDGSGHLIRKTEHDGSRTNYQYDNAGNLINIKSPHGQTLTYVYNPANELIRYTNGLSETSYELDLLGRVIAVNQDHRRADFKYDGNGNKTEVIYPNGTAVEYVYDERDRTIGIGLNGRYRKYMYDGNSNITLTVHMDGTREERTYDPRNRLLTVQREGGPESRYEYDPTGNLMSSWDAIDEVESIYQYDEMDRVISLDSHRQFITQKMNRFYYDKMGNLEFEMEHCGDNDDDGDLGSEQSGEPQDYFTTREYQHNRINQLTHIREERSNIASGFIDEESISYHYDVNDNLLFSRSIKGETDRYISYGFDGNNRMTYAWLENGFTQYEYDGIGKTVMQDNNILLPDPTSMIDRALFAQGMDEYTNYIYGPEGIAAISFNQEDYNVSLDRMGSIESIQDGNGEEVARFQYDVWGKPKRKLAEGYDKEMLLCAPNYTGHCYNEKLEMYHAKARMYSPKMRKFASTDPARNGKNWTQYCLSNPMRYVDPTGESAEEIGHNLNVIKVMLTETSGEEWALIAVDTLNAGANTSLGQSVAILGGAAKGVNSLGRLTIGNLAPETRDFFNAVDCGIFVTEEWVRYNVATDLENYDFGKSATEKILIIYGGVKLVQGIGSLGVGAYQGWKSYKGQGQYYVDSFGNVIYEGMPLANSEIIVVGSNAKKGTFILRQGIDDMPIGNVVAPGKSVSIGTTLEIRSEYEQIFKSGYWDGRKGKYFLSGTFVEDVRAAGFDVVYAPTQNNSMHARIIADINTFDDFGREWLSAAFDLLSSINIRK